MRWVEFQNCPVFVRIVNWPMIKSSRYFFSFKVKEKTHHSNNSFSSIQTILILVKFSGPETSIDQNRDGKDNHGDQPVIMRKPVFSRRPHYIRSNISSWSCGGCRGRGCWSSNCWGCWRSRRLKRRHTGDLSNNLRCPVLKVVKPFFYYDASSHDNLLTNYGKAYINLP